MVAFSDAFLQELKYRCDIESVATRYVNLRKSGRTFVGLCPFHSEKTPSFHVYPDTQNFYCFGCGKGGDIITFIRSIENLDYVDAVRFLAKIAGLEVPEDDSDSGEAAARRRVLEMNREAARYYHNCLKQPEGEPGRQYFAARKLLPETLTRFGLGYAPQSWTFLRDHLREKGFTDEEMRVAALIRVKNNSAYDQFRKRVIFPIIDLQGNVIAFGGRVLDDSKPKYLNSADTPVFKKSRSLFALNFAKNGASDSLILCEGYMDVIALHQAGFKNAVATLGTALTTEQARLMARYAKEIVVSYDSDEAGQKATARATVLLTEAGLKVRVLKIQGGKDPDEFIKANGPEKFKILIEKSGGYIDYSLEKAKKKYNLDIPQQKVDYIKEAAGILANVESRIEREVYAGRLAQDLSISKEMLMAEILSLSEKNGKKRRKSKIREEMAETAGTRDRINPQKSRYLKAARAEESIIVLLYKNPDFLKKIDAMIGPENFMTDFNKRVYSCLRQQILEDRAADLYRLSEYFTTDEISKLTRMLMVKQVSNTIEEARECAQVILKEKLLKSKDGKDEIQLIRELANKKLEEKKKAGGNNP